MEKYVLVTKVKRGLWQVNLNVGVQRFLLGQWETKTEANWFRDMLCIALDKVRKDKEA